jgi:general secretion pathway protein B
MSYILDALKKSERKRPPGSVPDLFTVQGPLPPPADRRRRTAGVAALAIVGLAAVLGWVWFQGRERPVVETPAQPAVPARPPAARDAAPAPAAKAAIPSSQRPALAGRSVAAGGAPKAGSSAVSKSAASLQRAVPSAPSAPVPAVAPPLLASPAAAPAPAPALVPLPVDGTDTVPSTGPAAAVPADAAPVLPPAEGAPPADSRVVGIEELPADVRAALGKFAISGHVWSEEPALRLVTVQDRIVREGGEAAPGVRLEEITQTGAVLTVRGWRFHAGF